VIFQRSARVKGIQVASAVTLLDGDRDAVADGRQFGETLAQVARRYDVSRSQIYNWRHKFKKSGRLSAAVEATFLPVDIGAPMLKAQPAALPWIPMGSEDRAVSPSIVELGLAQGRRLRFDSGIESATLTRLIRSVEAA